MAANLKAASNVRLNVNFGGLTLSPATAATYSGGVAAASTVPAQSNLRKAIPISNPIVPHNPVTIHPPSGFAPSGIKPMPIGPAQTFTGSNALHINGTSVNFNEFI